MRDRKWLVILQSKKGNRPQDALVLVQKSVTARDVRMLATRLTTCVH